MLIGNVEIEDAMGNPIPKGWTMDFKAKYNGLIEEPQVECAPIFHRNKECKEKGKEALYLSEYVVARANDQNSVQRSYQSSELIKGFPMSEIDTKKKIQQKLMPIIAKRLGILVSELSESS